MVHGGADCGRCCGKCGWWYMVVVIVNGDCGWWYMAVVIVGGGMVVEGGGRDGWRCSRWTMLGSTLLRRFLCSPKTDSVYPRKPIHRVPM